MPITNGFDLFYTIKRFGEFAVQAYQRSKQNVSSNWRPKFLLRPCLNRLAAVENWPFELPFCRHFLYYDQKQKSRKTGLRQVVPRSTSYLDNLTDVLGRECGQRTRFCGLRARRIICCRIASCLSDISICGGTRPRGIFCLMLS